MFEEVAQSQGKKEENKDATSAAVLLENLSVTESKSKDEKSSEETPVATKEEEKKEAECVETKPAAEKKDEEPSSGAQS